jgi:hypothetical protein
VHLVERDDVDATTLQPPQQTLEEHGRDFEQPVRLERVGPRRAHVMQCQDAADATEQRPHQMMHAAEIERLEPRPDDGSFHLPCPFVRPVGPKAIHYSNRLLMNLCDLVNSLGSRSSHERRRLAPFSGRKSANAGRLHRRRGRNL